MFSHSHAFQSIKRRTSWNEKCRVHVPFVVVIAAAAAGTGTKKRTILLSLHGCKLYDFVSSNNNYTTIYNYNNVDDRIIRNTKLYTCLSSSSRIIIFFLLLDDSN